MSKDSPKFNLTQKTHKKSTFSMRNHDIKPVWIPLFDFLEYSKKFMDTYLKETLFSQNILCKVVLNLNFLSQNTWTTGQLTHLCNIPRVS